MMTFKDRNRFLAGAVLIAGMIGSGGSPVRAQPPEKSGATKLEIPEKHAKLGKVYHVHPGKDAQATFTSDAPLEHVKGTSNQVIGYAVAPEKTEGSEFNLLAGEFHLPVASFDTGIKMRNGHLQEKRWLDAKTYPNVIFVLTGTNNAKVEKSGDGFTTYSLELVGDMTIHGTTRNMTIPARITVMPESAKTKNRAPGNLLAIRTEFPIKLSDFGVAVNESVITAGSFSNDLQLDIFLMLSTTPPEKRG